MVKPLLYLLIASLLAGCTPTVKEVALYGNKKGVVIVQRGKLLLSAEEKSFIREEAERLGIAIPDRREIRNHLKELLSDRRSLEIALKRASLYVPYIKPILKEYGLPEELALLPLVESGFNPFAVSRSGAAGIWQLMPFTAKRFGLRVDSSIDERFDLVKSTHAAAKYLKELYSKFGNWELAIAAYNCGEGCVSRRTKGANFWRSKEALPEQTRRYVPKFFAALLVARSPHRYGLKVGAMSMEVERKVIKRDSRVRSFVKKLGIKESTFRDLNPHIRSERIPSGAYVYLPGDLTEQTELKRKDRAERTEAKKIVRKVSTPKLEAPPPRVERKKMSLAKAKPRKPVEVKRQRKAESNRIVIKGIGESLNIKTQVIRLDNGALLYIKE
jgi:membrane-bound lytic murein transglycosylase D